MIPHLLMRITLKMYLFTKNQVKDQNKAKHIKLPQVRLLAKNLNVYPKNEKLCLKRSNQGWLNYYKNQNPKGKIH